MREIDRIAMEETGPNLYQMMENAGRSLALLALELLGHGWEKASILVLAGSGGNGGGGICAARHLANRGANVGLLLASPQALGEVPSWQHKIFEATSGRELKMADLAGTRPDLILDALIGYGLDRAPHGAVADLIRWTNGRERQVLSLDVPSGLNATTGDAPGDLVCATWTLTLALPKAGLQGLDNLFLADLGIPAEVFRRIGIDYRSPFGNRFWVRLRSVEGAA